MPEKMAGIGADEGMSARRGVSLATPADAASPGAVVGAARDE